MALSLRPSALAGLLGSAVIAAAGVADSTLTYDTGDDRLIVESRGDDVRMGPASGDDGYVLLKDGAVYAVSTTGDGPLVIDLGAMMQSFSAMMPPGMAEEAFGDAAADGPPPKVTRTGRNETHAGVKGEVVTLTMPDGERSEVVLTDDPDVSAGFVAFQRVAESLVADMPPGMGGAPMIVPQVTLGEELARSGVLRVEDTMTLIAIDRTAPDAARFALPAQPITNPMELMAR